MENLAWVSTRIVPRSGVSRSQLSVDDISPLHSIVTHRANISSHVRKIVYFLTRFGATVAALALAQRPLSIWWAMYQIKA